MKWESFIDNLTSGEIVPVIGDDVILVKDENDKPIPLQSYIAAELCRKLDIPYEGQGISEIALAYPNENIMLTANSIYNKIEEERFYLEPLEKLADISDFKFFISTTLDDFLEKALRKVRNLKGDRLKVINYSLQQLSDTPTDEEEKLPVTVFNLMGGFDNVTESAFNEEEMLEQVFSLANRYNRHPLADYFAEQIKHKILLFIGCDFPDWFMRFIIRIMTHQRYKFRVFSDYVVSDNIDKFPDLTKFLKRFNKNIITLEGVKEGNVTAFIDELYDRWSEFQETRPIRYEETIFLSYNHPDQEKVKTLKDLLRKKGVRNVWFDIDDLPSGEHKVLIEEEIKKCKVFIPLISNNSLTNNQSYTWQVEWAGIEARLAADKYYGKMSFHIIPVILDETARSDERIPAFLRDFSIWELEKNKDRVIEEITNALTPL